MKLFGTSCFLSLLCLLGMAQGSVVVYPATHYVQRSDSPFYAGIQSGTIYLEDFEDELFNSPYVSSANATVSLLTRYSVDEDDGVVDGVSNGLGLAKRTDTPPGPLVFDFVPDAQGHYPRFVGLVITSYTLTSADNLTGLEFLGVKDINGGLILSNQQFILPNSPTYVPPESSFWATFIGVYADEGISQITLDSASRIDHLQYGYSIPEASSLVTLSAAGLAGIAFRRRRPQIHG